MDSHFAISYVRRNIEWRNPQIFHLTFAKNLLQLVVEFLAWKQKKDTLWTKFQLIKLAKQTKNKWEPETTTQTDAEKTGIYAKEIGTLNKPEKMDTAG